ncbi:hypothetical protein [Nostoc sp. NMS7]|uniref:hypothetical protein n=1 Tax=Nostoc sp. NMS7 TaxID=2815391 RepID=UPI0025FBCA66|nr:hypothetical protein [Nostoc sp. NMS7]
MVQIDENYCKHFEARTQAAKALALKTEVRQRFLEANGCKDDQSFDSLWNRIKNKIQIQEGEVRIVAQNGTPKFSLTGSMMTLSDFIQSLKQDLISGKSFLN